MLMFRRTILQIGYLFIPTQALHKKNSLAAVSALTFFFFFFFFFVFFSSQAIDTTS